MAIECLHVHFNSFYTTSPITLSLAYVNFLKVLIDDIDIDYRIQTIIMQNIDCII